MNLTWRSLPAWPYEENAKQPDRFKTSRTVSLKKLVAEIAAIHGRDPIIGVVVPAQHVRRDGMGLTADARYGHAGAEVSFDVPEGRAWRRLTFHTDAFRQYVYADSVTSNLRAIALGLEALRTVNRYGITTSGQQYAGFAQLTAGPGLEELGKTLVEQHGGINEALRATHPDTGGQYASARDFQAVVAYRKSVEA